MRFTGYWYTKYGAKACLMFTLSNFIHTFCTMKKAGNCVQVSTKRPAEATLFCYPAP